MARRRDLVASLGRRGLASVRWSDVATRPQVYPLGAVARPWSAVATRDHDLSERPWSSRGFERQRLKGRQWHRGPREATKARTAPASRQPDDGQLRLPLAIPLGFEDAVRHILSAPLPKAKKATKKNLKAQR